MAQKTAQELYEDLISNSENMSYEDAILEARKKALEEKNYKDYFNSSLQLYNYRNQAQKYINNSLASQGLNTQGYGSSVRAGINNNALNMYSEIANNYANNNLNIQEDYLNGLLENATERDNQLATFITNDINTTGGKNINQYLMNYGYMDENGNYTDARNNLDASRKNYLSSLMVGATSNNSATENYGEVFDINSNNDTTIYYYDKDGNSLTNTIQNTFREELPLLRERIARNEIPSNSYIELTNGYGDKLYLYYSDGSFYYVSKAVYDKENSANKIQLGK